MGVALQAHGFELRRTKAMAAVVAVMLTVLALVTPNSGRPAAVASRATAAVDDALLKIGHGTVKVIVQSTGRAAHAEHTVQSEHGIVTRQLPIINGFSATVPAESIPTIAADPSVRAITLDRHMSPQSGNPPQSNIKSVYPQVVRSTTMQQAGYTGAGVTVALIDTGIADVPDLAGRVLPVTDDVTGATSPCENLSGEPSCADSYGHGTFVAGLIAGNGAASNGKWKGAAPGANLVSIKIAGADGSADVSNVIAGIQFAVSFKDKYGIKVLNLSLGTDSTQSYHVDPLNYAVEKAWDSGIAVVVSAANLGPGAGTISKPGDDPLVITVGAEDDRGTSSLNDDQVPNFSSRGPTAADGLAKPDVVAPGAHVISLRAPGSAIDTQFPTYVDGSYRKGSGTSMATGVTSGVVALMIQANPTMVPDRIKYALSSTARPVATTDPMVVGAGVIDAYRATFTAPAGLANQGVARSSGLGSIDASRGTVQVSSTDPAQTVVSGTLTAQLLLWDPLVLTAPWTGSSWYGSSWYGSSWYGSSWYGSSWYGSSWYGSSWYGQMDGSSWYGSSWYGSSWYGAWE